MKKLLMIALFGLAASAFAQQETKLNLTPSSPRTIAITADETETSEPEFALLHVGFNSCAADAETAYKQGSSTSNAVFDTLVAAGIPKTSIHSESQSIARNCYEEVKTGKTPKYRVTQEWTVKVPPPDAAKVLDAAVKAGANTSGEIEWIVNDPNALEEKAAAKAMKRARRLATAMAEGMGVKLGPLVYASNQATSVPRPVGIRMMAMKAGADDAQPLAISPSKVSRSATVYAVFAIE